MNFTIYIIHYKGNADRRLYLESAFSRLNRRPNLITNFDRGEFEMAANYAFDERAFRRMIEPIKEIMVGYAFGLSNSKNAPWSNCVATIKEKNHSLNELEAICSWLRPRALSVSEVSLFLKHRFAWQQIADGPDEWALVAEDDIVHFDYSLSYLMKIIDTLPTDSEYIDLAGGCGLFPRIGNRVVNKVFFEIEPGRDRTTCCALVRKSFVQRLLGNISSICIPVDWHLTHSFARFGTKVYWLDPPLFGHGSEMKIYKSSILDRPV
jgi:hypothetical protein